MGERHTDHHAAHSLTAGVGNQQKQQNMRDSHEQSMTKPIQASTHLPATAAAVPSARARRALIPAVSRPIRRLRESRPASFSAYPFPSSPCERIGRQGIRSFREKSVSKAASWQKAPAAPIPPAGPPPRGKAEASFSGRWPYPFLHTEAFSLLPLRMRGSTTPYRRSARKFPAKTMAAVATVIPIRRGTSLPRPAVTAACPSPG